MRGFVFGEFRQHLRSLSGGSIRPPCTLSPVLIPSVYIGFAVADGRWVVVALESNGQRGGCSVPRLGARDFLRRLDPALAS